MNIVVEFSEESLKQYCHRCLPGMNESLTLSHLDCAMYSLRGLPCPLCKEFNDAISEAIVREAARRIE